MKLEIVTAFERVQKRIALLTSRFPALRVICRSSFFVILGCHLEADLAPEERQWLEELVADHTIERFRCKAREDR